MEMTRRRKKAVRSALMSEEMKKQEPDWAKIRGEYVNSSISLKALAKKYGVSPGTLQKRSARGKWSEKRKKLAGDKEERVSERLHERDVKQTVKDIERVCRAAGKLIDKVTKAIAQVDKERYVCEDNKVISTKKDELPDGTEVVDQTVKRKMKTRQLPGNCDTKKLSELSKTLLNLKQVLTGEDGSADDTENSGLIVIAGQDLIDENEKQSNGLATAGEMVAAEAESDLEAAAEAGVDVAASGR